MYIKLVRFLIVVLFCGAFAACEDNYNTPSFSCNNYYMDLVLHDSTYALKVSNNTLFRIPSDSGGSKYITMETLTDSFKVIFNLRDGLYQGDDLLTDSLPLKTYTYPAHRDSIVSGLVVVAVKTGNEFRFADTDTSSVTITRWSTSKQTMSGSYYFESNNHTFKGKGTFNKVCFTPLR
ncbi:hypothetical protein [Chitinophaga sp.]|uniref:hypothetical protein n=1 Tax=Chitinophaga sp. TaxID=1869181 RepID=UPI002DBCB4C8|nr:hypothetical protein [Chitinophaga sp.]